MTYQLAQLNIGRILAPMDSETMKGFVDRLDEINTLAEAAPGFVWRLQDEAGDATSYRPFDDDMLLINMSVWEDLESLKNFTYKSMHVEVMRHRKLWFEHLKTPYIALWWVPAGHRPDLLEAKQKLEKLQAEGPGPEVFDFRNSFPAP